MEIGFDLRMTHLGGGGWNYPAQLILHLLRLGHDADWRLYHNPWSQPQLKLISLLREQFPHHDGRIQLQAVRHGCLSLGQHLEFRAFRPNCSLYHYPHFDMPLPLRRVPLVMTIHDLYPLVLPGYCSWGKREYFRHICRHNALRAGRVIAISEMTRQDIIERLKIPPEKVTVVIQGHAPAFAPLTEGKLLENVRNRLRLPQRFILYAGNHKPHKNLKRLIEAYAALEKDLREEFALVLVGPISEDTEHLLALTAALQVQHRVFFTGVLEGEDLPPVFNLASLLVQPSLYEGFGMPPLEAMACGTPVICARAGALPEVAGNAARLFDPYDVVDMTDVLAQALRQDVDNPQVRRKMRERAGQFSWEEAARQTWNIYQSLVK